MDALSGQSGDRQSVGGRRVAGRAAVLRRLRRDGRHVRLRDPRRRLSRNPVTASTCELGRNPRGGPQWSPDNATVYVYNALDFNLVAYDTKQLEPVATIQVCAEPLSESVHRGKVLVPFGSSSRWSDGDGFRVPVAIPMDSRTVARGRIRKDCGIRSRCEVLAWTHPLHWSADRDEVQDFEHTIRGPLMQGRGLIRGEVHESLGQPNKGLSADLDALAAYTNSHAFTLSPYAKHGLSELAEEGRAIFLSETTRCAKLSCRAVLHRLYARPSVRHCPS